MVLFVSTMLLILFIFIIGTGLLHFRMKIRQAKGLVVVLMLLIVVFAYIFEPKTFIRWDLLRYYELCDRMSAHGLDYAFAESEYNLFAIINLFFYIVSKIGNYALISALPMAIDAIIIVYILFDVLIKCESDLNNDSESVDMFQLSYTLFALLSTVSVKMAIAGVRCNLAVSISALAIYWEFIKGEKRITSYILHFIACLIHPFSMFVVLLRLACFVKKKYILVTSVLAFVLLFEPIIGFLRSNISNSYFSLLLYKLNRYWQRMSIISGRFYTSQLLTYVCWIAVIAFMSYMIHIVAKRMAFEDNDNLYLSKVLEFNRTLIAISIGAAFNYLFIQRIMYIAAFGLLFILPYYLKTKHSKIVDFGMWFAMFYIFFINDIYGLIVNYTGVYFLAQ